MEFKGTKGEWAVKDDFREPKIVNESGQVIFTHNKSCFDSREYSNVYYSHNKMMANSKLIAAAPDLLEALHILIDSFEDLLINSKNPNKAEDFTGYVKAKQAVEKALK